MSNFDIETREIEFKFSQEYVKLSKFIEFQAQLNPEKKVEVQSWDVYFSPKKTSVLPFEFMRLRLGEKPELTIKVQTTSTNNNNRIEIDLPLSESKSEDELLKIVASYCEQFGFYENFRIFKHCFIFFYKQVDIVYYISYNEDMKEIGRYIEVEQRKDAQFTSEEEAVSVVKELEQKLSVFGITPQNRIKRSQWQINRRDE